MPDFGIMRGFNEKLFGDKLVAGQLPTQLGLIGSEDIESLLLDFYPNAAAAYSVRKLRNAYTGNAIRVRRTDSAEQNIGFTSAGNLDTTALLAFTGTGVLDNGFITTWYDQSGNARNATQATALSQPQIVNSGNLNTMNLLSAIKFDGINDRLTLSISIPSQNTYSVFAVGFVNSSASGADMLIGGPNGSAGFRFDGGSPNGKITITRVNQVDIINANTPSNQQTLGTFLTNNSNSKAYTNGVLRGTGAVVNQTAVINTIGDESTIFGQPYLGNMQEIVLYTTDQSIDQTGIETNINTYYAIY
jgi:hypothetical protein